MATIYKELISKINLVGDPMGATDYYFTLPVVTGTRLPHSLDNQVLEEVYIICDSSLGAININLPSTTIFNGVWNTKIYISWMNGGNSVNINPYPGFMSETDPILPDSLNGLYLPYTMQQLNEAVYLHQVYDYTWMKLVCPGPLR